MSEVITGKKRKRVDDIIENESKKERQTKAKIVNIFY